MKQLTVATIILLTFFSHLYADESNESAFPDMYISLKNADKFTEKIPKKRKSSKSFYKKFKNLFSDYDKTWVEDMVTYSFDIMMPDEIMLATEDVIKNRDTKGFSSHIKNFSQEFGNDVYNIMLTTAYYNFQDISRITKELWEDDACDPDTFIYDINDDPKVPLLNLKANDENARGVTSNGVVLPVNDNFPDALYPYASKPNGCSAEGLQKLYDQANDLSDDNKWLSQACDAHDRCYYTLGTTSKECNEKLIIDTIDSCNEISGRNTLLYMGTKNAFCGFKALAVSTGADACAHKYFAQAQREQKAYMQWVKHYEKAYFKAKQKKHNADNKK